jgi:uncharacterized heparinase superfamily protein
VARSAGGQTQLWSLVAGEAFRRGARRLRAGPRHRWRFGGRTPERVLIAPPDMRHADPQIASEIYAGRFPLSGHLVRTGGLSPFQIAVANPGWVKSLHGFRWLRHMRAAGTDLATANARALVADWISTHGGRIDKVAWAPGTTAKRIIAWLQHSGVVLQGADVRFYRAFLRSLAAQVRYLRWAIKTMPEGKERLRAAAALSFAALSLPSSAAAIRSATRQLETSLDQQILPDGGHVSRHPLATVELLADLLPLKHTYLAQTQSLPPALLGAIERMMPAIRFFRHRDGALARFNGMGATIHDRVAAILRHDESNAAPLLTAPHSGYERLALGDTLILADTGAPPRVDLSGHANAGCLSFEMSCGQQCFIVNCGIDTYGAVDVRPLGRATAAHSTLTLNDTSQARFNHSERVRAYLGTPLIGGPAWVSCTRTDTPSTQGFVAAHDGYLASFGLYHERALILGAEGALIDGTDRLFRKAGQAPRSGGRDSYSIRFHLHPDIEVSLDGRYIVLASRGGVRWRFGSPDVAPRVEDTLYLAGLSGPRRSRQIVLVALAAEAHTVRWRFERVMPSA